MKIVRAGEEIPKSYKSAIFLAGPTPRDAKMKSWRPEACEELKEQGYNGIVFSPERDDWKGNYLNQVKWEDECLNLADCILFWVPRNMDMPAFTTNVEYGEWLKSGKVVLGFPPEAEKMTYLETKARDNFVPVTLLMRETVRNALSMTKDGALRKDGERYVPLQVWNTKSFQNWYDAIKKAGNKLEKAKVLWTFRVGPDKKIVFSWILHVDVYITKEKRHKTNEFVLSRTDISTVVAYYPNKNLGDTEILMVKEFRSPCTNASGFVYEAPGGSSKDTEEGILSVAVNELREETGLKIDKRRFDTIQSRQLMSTLSGHKAHLFAVELTEEEMKTVRKNAGKTRGVKSDTEKTYTWLCTFREALQSEDIDWSMLGMLSRVLLRKKPTESDNKDWVGEFLD